MKAANYSRFSMDRQTESSIADQVHVRTEHAQNEGLGREEMSRQVAYAVLAGALICGWTASAADDTPRGSIPGYSVGLGNHSCGKFLVATASMDWITPDDQTRSMNWENKAWISLGAAYEQWLMGYVTGAQPKPLDRESLLIAVRKICEKHPDEILASAASRFAAQRGKYGQ